MRRQMTAVRRGAYAAVIVLLTVAGAFSAARAAERPAAPGPLAAGASLTAGASTATSAPLGWSQVTGAGPSPRAVPSLAYDPALGEDVLFGGYSQDSGSPYYIPTAFDNDTWVFNGSTWTELFPADSPPARAGAAMAYDPALGEIILEGGEDASGFLNDTWAFNGTNWTQLNPPQSPLPTWGSTVAYDPSLGDVVLVDGSGQDAAVPQGYLIQAQDTFNGSNWEQLVTAANPPGRHYATMAYDPSLGQIVLFGGANGSQYFGDTWTFDGTNWTQLNPATSPSPRYDGAMAYDSSTGDLLHFGGSNNSGVLSDTWLFSGSNWVKAAPAVSPAARAEEALAPDPAGGVVLFGGIGNSGYLGDTWVWHATDPGAPTSVSASAGAGAVSLHWTAPASDGGTAVSGYDIYESTTPGGENLADPVNAQPVTGTSDTVTGLSNGTTYYFEVVALNAVGPSLASGEVHATPVTVPGAPTALTATAGLGTVTLHWAAPASDGGSPVTGYDIYESTTSGGENLAEPVNAQPVTGTSDTVTGLEPGATVYFEVVALNAVGPSPASGEVQVTLPRPLAFRIRPPEPPLALSATPGDGTVTLSWTAPSADGGAAVSGYEIYESTTPGAEDLTEPVNPQPVTATSFTVTGLSNGVTYDFIVEARNVAGSSGPSNEAQATPVAPPASTGTTTVPTTPTGTPTPLSPPAPRPAPRVLTGRVRVAHDIVTVGLRLSGPGRVSVRLRLLARERVSAGRRTGPARSRLVSLGTRVLILDSQHTVLARVGLDPAGRRLLARAGHLQLTLVLSARGQTLARRSVVLRRASLWHEKPRGHPHRPRRGRQLEPAEFRPSR